MVEAVIVSTARTPIGRAMRGAFNLTHGAEMGGHVIRTAVERAGIEPGDVEEVVLGCANPEGATGGNIARQAALRAGLSPAAASAMTVNRFCSSGLQAMAIAANRVVCDGVPAAVAGGLESISLVQTTLNRNHYKDEWLEEHTRRLHADDRDGRHRRRPLRHQPRGAGRIRAGKPAPHRRRAAGRPVRPGDRAACRPPRRCATRQGNEIGREEVNLRQDEGNRPETTLEGLAKLKPVRGEDQFITAGNASQLSDGAQRLRGDVGRARRPGAASRRWACSAASRSPAASRTRWGSGPSTPFRGCWSGTGLTVDDIDLWELNEAFASQVIYCRDTARHPERPAERGWRRDRDRPPVWHERRAHGRPRADRGEAAGCQARRVTMCIGGGQGAAGLFEIV